MHKLHTTQHSTKFKHTGAVLCSVQFGVSFMIKGVVWRTQFTAQFKAWSVGHMTVAQCRGLREGLMGLLVPILSHSYVSIPIRIPIPELQYTMSIPIFMEFPVEKCETGIPISDEVL